MWREIYWDLYKYPLCCFEIFSSWDNAPVILIREYKV